jgi:hypothetical protein
MEKLIKIENDYSMGNYYYGIIEDVRNVFINYGRYLERNDIPEEGSFEDYEIFLQFQNSQEKEFEIDNYIEKSSEKQEDYLELLAFLTEQQDWDRELIIIRKENWNEFYSTDDKGYEMKIASYVQASQFYDRFSELVGIDITQFENNFVSAKYIDDYTENTIELVINVDGKDKTFIIDAA